MLWFGQVVYPSVVSAQERLALVVGNSAYGALGDLSNPPNDARDVAAALGRLGFATDMVLDVDLAALNDALRAFGRRTRRADVALVFYAGHGIELNGVNYLVPVDAQLELDTDVRYETVTLDDVLAATVGAALRLVILDACRNNPLAGGTRSISRGSLGAPEEERLGSEVLVAYAARAGTVALDGRGQRNSPYTAALLEYLEEPLELSAMFRRVRGHVLEATAGGQEPREYGALVSDHYLGGARPLSAREVEAALGLDRAARQALQVGLVAEGYAVGRPDGEFGPRTRDAIREWQVARGETETGYLNEESATSLREAGRDWLSGLGGGLPLAETPVDPPDAPTGTGGYRYRAGSATGAGGRRDVQRRLSVLSGNGRRAGGNICHGLRPRGRLLSRKSAAGARCPGAFFRAVEVRGNPRTVRGFHVGFGL